MDSSADDEVCGPLSNSLRIADGAVFRISYDSVVFNLTLIAITGIEDPLRDGVCEVVAKCQKASVTIKMCTGDNVLTAHSITLRYGIYIKGGIITEGLPSGCLARRECLRLSLVYKFWRVPCPRTRRFLSI